MPNPTHINIEYIHPKTLEELTQIYLKKYKTQGKKYTYEQIKEALEYLSYHTAVTLPKMNKKIK